MKKSLIIFLLILNVIVVNAQTTSFNKYISGFGTDSTQLNTPNICGVSVDTNYNYRIIYWENKDTNITKYIIYNKALATQQFDSIAIVNAQKFNIYVDSSLWLHSDSYKIQAINDSGSRSELSPEVKSYFFQAQDFVDDSLVKLIWNKGNAGDSVIIWRRNYPNFPEYRMLKKLSINDTTYIDTITSLTWYIEYRLEILKRDPCYSTIDTLNKIRIFAKSDNTMKGAVGNNPKRVLQVFPNPASNKIAIESNTIYNHYYIFNLYGQQILEGDLQNNEINIFELSKGLYILKLASDKEYVQVKFIKE